MNFKNIITDKKARWQISADLIIKNSFKMLCEVGVSRGDHARGILEILRNYHYSIDRFFLIDLDVQHKKEYTTNINPNNVEMFNFNPKKLDCCTYWPMGSMNASRTIRDNTLEFIFLDADTSKEESLELDINLWLPKLTNKGILAGRYLVFAEDAPSSFIKHLLNKIFGSENISLHLLQEKCSGRDDYYWYYKKEKTVDYD